MRSVQERVVPEIGMLRAMWRVLETGLRTDLAGHEGETSDTDKLGPSELPRQLSTLPRLRTANFPLPLVGQQN
jgi:hypothetical protein